MSAYLVGMRKILFLALLLAAACSPVAYRPSGPQMLPEDLADRVVALVEPEEKTGLVRAYCSGVWVSDTVIATAFHCLGDIPPSGLVKYVVKTDVFYPGDLTEHKTKGHSALVVGIDEDHDLALLGVIGPIPLHKYATISNEQLYQGEVVQTMGAPKGLMWSYSHGDISSVRLHDSVGGVPMVFVQTTAPISPGNSGGALFNMYGEVVGICHASYRGSAQGLNLFIHYQYLDALVRKTS